MAPPLVIRQSSAVPGEDEERFDGAVANNVRAGLGGVAVALPVVVLAAVGAPRGLMVAYLIAATAVLAVLVGRRRLDGSSRAR